MKLYGSNSCTDCIIAKKLLKKYKQNYEWVDVSTIPNFEGMIPQLEVDEIVPLKEGDNRIIGLNEISKYLKGGR